MNYPYSRSLVGCSDRKQRVMCKDFGARLFGLNPCSDTSCVTLGELFSLSVFQFLYLQNEAENSIYCLGLS